MLDRLKSLPLTIILTILIWMYAEAQFTTQQEGVGLNLRVTAPTKEFAVRVYDPAEGRLRETVSLRVTVQGAQNKVDQFYKKSIGAVLADEDLANLSFTVAPGDLQTGTKKTFDTVALLNTLSYFRRNGLLITSANPPRFEVTVEKMKLLSRPVIFRSAALPNAQVTTITPARADIMLPQKMLDDIGGPESLTVVAAPIRDVSTLVPGVAQLVPARLTVEYPAPNRDELISITPSEVNVSLKIPVQKQDVVDLSDVPVEVAGSPELLRKWNVEVKPPLVHITVTGPAGSVSASLARRGAKAVLDLDISDSNQQFLSRPLRYVLPEGIVLREGPKSVEFRLIDPQQPAATATSNSAETKP